MNRETNLLEVAAELAAGTYPEEQLAILATLEVSLQKTNAGEESLFLLLRDIRALCDPPGIE